MRKLFLTLFIAFFSCHAVSQALPVSKVQAAISAAIQNKQIKRGFAANDPRYGSTISSVSGLLSSVAGGTAGVIVAGAITAPAWATVAISIGVGAVVTAGVTLAVNGLLDWLFSPSSTDPTPITQHSSSPISTGNGLTQGGPYWQTSILGIMGSDPMSAIQTAVSLNWPADAGSTYEVGTCTTTTNPTKTSCLITRVNKTTGFKQTGYAAISATFVPSGAPANCQPGFVYRPTNCIAVPAQTLADAKVSAQQAIDNIPSSELAKPLNPSLIATLADKAWRDAAAMPGYNGLPYVATDPITSAEVNAWKNANPAAWPTVQDFVAPQPATYSPWTLPADPLAPTQNPTTSTSPSTNPAANNPLQNLGPDPGIGAPTLESTPTAQQILQPLLNLFPDFRTFVVPSHQATCPKPSFNVFGKTIVMESHCDISESIRATLFAVMSAVWVMGAAIIILKA